MNEKIRIEPALEAHAQACANISVQVYETLGGHLRPAPRSSCKQ